MQPQHYNFVACRNQNTLLIKLLTAPEAYELPLTKAHELGLVLQESFENYTRLLGRRIGHDQSLCLTWQVRLLTTDRLSILKIRIWLQVRYRGRIYPQTIVKLAR